MLGEEDYKKISSNRNKFIIFSAFSIIFISGITFTFAIPFKEQFSLFHFTGSGFIYWLIAYIYNGLFSKKSGLVFLSTLLLSCIGLCWRILLEWGEHGISSFLTPFILCGYPLSIALLITTIYTFLQFQNKESADNEKSGTETESMTVWDLRSIM